MSDVGKWGEINWDHLKSFHLSYCVCLREKQINLMLIFIESKIIPIKALLILLLCFKSFCLRHDVARNSTKFIISSKLILQILSVSIFYKKLLNICHPNGYRVVPSFRMDSKVLEAPTLLNHMTFFGNFVFGKCYSISKRLCLPFSKKYSLSFH